MKNTKTVDVSNEYLLSERDMHDEVENQTFAQYIREKRKEVFSMSGKVGISIGEHAEKLGITKEMFRKILNKQKPNQSRDCIIAICAAIGMDVEDTNEALRLYQYYPQLDDNSPRDRIIMDVLDGEVENTIDIQVINNRLARHGYNPLNIIEHRAKATVSRSHIPERFHIVAKKVRTSTDSLLYGDQYQSLATEYDFFRYHCWADMYVIDVENEQKYKLTADTSENYHLEKLPWPDNGDSPFVNFKSLNETGDFKDLFSELIDSAKNEQRRMESFLNDTKNYRERIGAGIYNGKIHVFYEQYNYVVPEFNEYYLFEYVDGTYKLTVAHESLFMQRYLSEKEYTSHYGKISEAATQSYDSIEKIEEFISDSRRSQQEREILRLRKRAYQACKEKVAALLEKLKTRQVFVNNLKYIWDDKDRVCEYFNVTEAFDCEFDNEYGDMMFAQKKEAEFTIESGETVLISIDDLYRAFELGFLSIADICKVKKKYGSIESVLY